MQLLVDNFNPATIPETMCRYTYYGHTYYGYTYPRPCAARPLANPRPNPSPNPNPNRRCRSLVSVSWDGKLHACTVKVPPPLAVPDPRLLGARLAALAGSALPGE